MQFATGNFAGRVNNFNFTFMTKTIIAIFCATVTANVFAAPDYYQHSNADMDQRFHADEFSIDAFGMGSIGRESFDHLSRHTIHHDGRTGLGVGANYFLTKYVGIGGDAYTENTHDSFVDSASGNIILRYPFENIHLAPFVFGGGGYQWDLTKTAFAQAGAGLEYRFAQHVGVFTDARYVFNHDTSDIGIGRVGLRFTF